MSKVVRGIALVVIVGCGGPAAPRQSETTVSLGGRSYLVEEFTDADTIRDAAWVGETMVAATDRGVLVFRGDHADRITTANGLPSNDVTAVAITSDQGVIAAAGAQLAIIRGDALNTALGPNTAMTVPSMPNVGAIQDVLVAEDHTVWACGLGGLARFRGGAWVHFGESVGCTTLTPVDSTSFYVGTVAGIWLVQGDVIREHAVGLGIPEAYTRSIAALNEGRFFALLQGPSSSVLGYFDGQQWSSYTLEGVTEQALSLGHIGSDIFLMTSAHLYKLLPGDTRGATATRELTALSVASPGSVSSYGARISPANTEPAAGRLREPSAFVIPESNRPSVEAATLVVQEVSLPPDTYMMFSHDATTVFARRNQGLVVRDARGEHKFATHDLLGQHLQVASDQHGRAWLVTDAHDVMRSADNELRRVITDPDFTPMALASGAQGVWVAGRAGSTGSILRVYRSDGDHLSRLFERPLALRDGEELAAVTRAAVSPDNKLWVAISVKRAGQEAPVQRGVAVIDAASEVVTFHHRGAAVATDGPGALDMPDDIGSIDFDGEGNAWFASVSGAIRVGNSQAIVFGEARGVRGEVVTDVVGGLHGRVWVAAAEGLGFYENRRFEFQLPQLVREAHPTELAMDLAGRLWAAGHRGLLMFDGTNWERVQTDSLPQHIIDVAAGTDLWLMSEDRLVLLRTR